MSGILIARRGATRWLIAGCLVALGLLISAQSASALPEVTLQVVDINAGIASSDPSGMVDWNGSPVFSADDGASRELYTVDDANQPVRLTTGLNLSANFDRLRASTPDQLVFAAGTGLYRLRATTGVEPVATVSDATGLTAVLNAQYVAFSASTGGSFSAEPWITDGTAAGTHVLADIAPGADGSFPEQFTPLTDSSFVFVADDLTVGPELWVSDGTTTSLVKDINATGDTDIRLLTRYRGKGLVLFSALDASGRALWVSDGTTSGTQKLAQVAPGAFWQAGNLMFFDGFDPTHGYELWVTDGTSAGTRLVKDINPGGGSAGPIESAAALGGQLYFMADDGVNGPALWVTDGTEAATQSFLNLAAGGSGVGIGELTAVGGEIYFGVSRPTTTLPANELWATDGTEAGTGKVADLPAFCCDQPFVPIGTAALGIVAADADHGNEPWLASIAGAPLPPVDIGLGDSVRAADTVEVAPSLMTGSDETVAASDAVVVTRAERLAATEPVGIHDDAAVRLALQIRVSEEVGASDQAMVAGPLIIQVSEEVAALDSAALRPALLLEVPDPVSIIDDVRVGSTPMASATPVAVADTLTITTIDRGSILDAQGNPVSRVVGGATVHFAGDGFDPGSGVGLWLHSTPIQLGSTIADAGGGFSVELTIPIVEGGEHTLVATGSSGGYPHEVQAVITVLMPVGVALDEANPVAVEVAGAGGASVPFELRFSLTLPAELLGLELPALDSSVALEPVGQGSPVTPTSCDQQAGEPTWVTCAFDDVPVNTYIVMASAAEPYDGADEDVLVVYDPSLGFTTGGGWFYWPGTDEPATGYLGDRTTFGYTMQYNKKGTNLKGSLLLIRHLADGTQYRLKSNALYGLALSDPSADVGWASFSGKATYQEPGWPDPIGNHQFVVYVEDHGSDGPDRLWIEVTDGSGDPTGLVMPGPALDEAAILEGGNIAVPHGRHRHGRT